MGFEVAGSLCDFEGSCGRSAESLEEEPDLESLMTTRTSSMMEVDDFAEVDDRSDGVRRTRWSAPISDALDGQFATDGDYPRGYEVVWTLDRSLRYLVFERGGNATKSHAPFDYKISGRRLQGKILGGTAPSDDLD
jgi:hypothetical protein